MSSGQRMHTRYFQVGGVIEDIPSGFEAKLRKFLDEMPTRADQYADLIEKNQIVFERLHGTCPLDEQTLLGWSVTGPAAPRRPAIPGTRKAHPVLEL